MKKTLFYLSVIFCFCFFLIYFLNRRSKYTDANGFRRNMKMIKMIPFGHYQLPSGMYGFIPGVNSAIVLQNYSEQRELLKFNTSLETIDTLSIKYPAKFDRKARNIYKYISSSAIYLSNPRGEIARISLHGDLNSFDKTGLRLDNLVSPSYGSVILRAKYYDSTGSNRKLVKFIIKEKMSQSREYLLPKQPDAFFRNDGCLQYDQKSAKIIYMYYYRGVFLTLDTNLKIIYQAKTIDTVRIGKLKITSIGSRDKNGKLISTYSTISGPPKFINTFITSNQGKIYVLSKLKANNETEDQFSINQPIDVYNLNGGNYLYSFYIPKYQGRKLNQFRIIDGTIVCLFGNYLISYKLLN